MSSSFPLLFAVVDDAGKNMVDDAAGNMSTGPDNADALQFFSQLRIHFCDGILRCGAGSGVGERSMWCHRLAHFAHTDNCLNKFFPRTVMMSIL